MSDAQRTPPHDPPTEATSCPARPLSDSQRADLGRWYAKFLRAACRRAAKVVERQDAEDVVHTAVTRLLVAWTRAKDPYAFPETEDAFRRLFYRVVRHVALDYLRGGGVVERPTRVAWGDAEPAAPRWNVPDRSLAFDAQPFSEDDDEGEEEDDAPVTRVARPHAFGALPDDADGRFREFVRHVTTTLGKLPQMQIHVLYALYYLGYDRAGTAAYLNVSPKTVDTHRLRAFARLRELIVDWPKADADDDNPWRDWIKRMRRRWLERQLAKPPDPPPPESDERAA